MSGTSRDALARHWPILGLRLATPRLALRPVCDDDLAEVVDLVLGGIHDPSAMPFATPWTDAPRSELAATTLRYHWQSRAASVPAAWSLHLAARFQGTLVGLQEISAGNFAVRRTVSTGSWLALPHHGQQFGTEMRIAVVGFAFDHLKATRAESAAFLDNPASLAVSRKVGYVPNGDVVVQRRPGEVAIEQRLLLTPSRFKRPAWAVQVAGLDACRSWFGL
jgi:RimJ/RimL family protein N-acetyltransferase